MIQKSDVSTRRILTFPAVHPCDSVSLAALLASLITLARKICDYRSRLFASNKRNARESIRLVGVLQNFLEEIRDRKSNIPVSIVLCLSELHLAFQKIQYLLEDCTREGARLWMLMKSERVSNQFRLFVRSIATALDVLPLESVDVSIEVNEMVELVTRQARKSRFEAEEDDELALKKVDSVLKLFEKTTVPDVIDLRRVLEHLGIQRWSECNQEIKFLDAEIGFELSNTDDKRTVAFLSSLMGFMSYCRCVMFDVVDGQSRQNSANMGRGEVLGCLNPDDFRCPISLEFMLDPVTIATGHTYDRSSVQKWFKAGNPTCPKTGERLTNEELVPNMALRRLIRQHCSDNGISIAESGSRNRNAARNVLAGSAVAEEAMKLVAKFLAGSLSNGTSEQKNKAAYEIRLLSKTSIFNRSCLAEAGTIPHLLNLLSSTDAVAQENAIAALLNLSKHSRNKTIIVENGGVLLILDVLKMGLRVEAKQHAAAVMFYLSSIEEYRKLIGEIPEAIPALVDLIKDGTDRAKKNALVTIFGLLMHHNNHWRVLAAGAVPLLLNLLTSSETEDVVTDSLAVLSNLAEKPDGTIAILRRGGLKLVSDILSSSNSRAGKEYCVSLLLALCVNGGGDVVSVLVKTQSLIGSLYTLLTEGTSRARKKASSIIRILHEFQERSSPGFKTLRLPQEQIVHMRSGKRNQEDEEYEDDDFGTRKEGLSSTNTNNVKEGKSNDQKANAIRSKHSVTEQRRRSKINERFQILRDLIPHSDQKRDTASFLLEVVEYVQYLQEKVQKYEGSYQGWSPEPTKLMPWRNSHWRVQSFVGHPQPLKNCSGPGSTFSGKFDESNTSITPTMLTNAQDQVESDLGGDAICRPTDQLPELANQGIAMPIPLQVKSPAPVQNDSRHTHPLHRPVSDVQSTDSHTTGDILNQHDDLMIEGGTISISSVYSQGLLNTLTQALQNAGVDLSQANMSVQIDLGKRANRQQTSGTFLVKDNENPPSSNKTTTHPREASSEEDSDQAQKRPKTWD